MLLFRELDVLRSHYVFWYTGKEGGIFISSAGYPGVVVG